VEENVLATATWTVNNEPKFNFGLLARRGGEAGGAIELTPSYAVAKLFGELLGSRYVPSRVTSPTYTVDPRHAFPSMRIPFLNAWLFARGDERLLLVVNRHRSLPVRLDLQGLSDYRPVRWTQVGGQGFNEFSDNHTVPTNVVARDRPVGPLILEPLSISLIRLQR
jgi:hypothetical protein